MHPVQAAGRSIDETFQALQPWIRYVHVHDGIDIDGRSELRPVGGGVIDVRRAMQLLHAARYDGYLSGEWIGWEPYAVRLPRELDKMLEYEQELA